jgi:hypothetical protein
MKTTAQNCSRSAELIRTCVTLMTGRIAIFSAAALLVALWPSEVSADDRSFPAEITGTIRSFDKATQTFTIQVDEPAGILTIGIGRDCKFIHHGAPARDETVRRGVRVRVKYFSTIFTGKIAIEIESNPRPLVKSGIIEKIEPADRKLTIRGRGCCERLVLRWTENVRCIKRGKTVLPKQLRENAVVRVNYYAPPFESKYAVEIEVEPRF